MFENPIDLGNRSYFCLQFVYNNRDNYRLQVLDKELLDLLELTENEVEVNPYKLLKRFSFKNQNGKTSKLLEHIDNSKIWKDYLLYTSPSGNIIDLHLSIYPTKVTEIGSEGVMVLKFISKRSKKDGNKPVIPQLRFIKLLDSIQESIFILDEDFKIVKSNKAAETMFLYSSEELIGKHINSFIPSKYQHQHTKMMQDYLNSDIYDHIMGKYRNVKAVNKYGKSIPVKASLGKASFEGVTLVIVALTSVIEENKNFIEKLKAHYLQDLYGSMMMLDLLESNISTSEVKEQKEILKKIKSGINHTLRRIDDELF